MFRINNIKIREDLTDNEIMQIAIKQNHINLEDIIEWHISKKSIDARKKDNVHYSYSIDFKLKNEKNYYKLEQIQPFEMPHIDINKNNKKHPLIIGAGPAGLFAAIILVQNGIKPIILEQGRLCWRTKRSNWKLSKNKKS